MALSKAPRPEVLAGITVKVATGCGSMYVQMNWSNGRLFEVFATLGKTGGCASCQSEGITRSVTMGLRCGVPVEEYIKQLRGLRCPTPMPFPKEKAVMSCPDALSNTLNNYGLLSGEDILKLMTKVVQGESVSGEEESDEEEAARAAAEIERLRREREEVEARE